MAEDLADQGAEGGANVPMESMSEYPTYQGKPLQEAYYTR
jgi:hypothetical protein